MNWMDNDELFRKECEEGHHWERVVCRKLKLLGCEVILSQQSIRKDVLERARHRGSLDAWINGNQYEIKSRRLKFNHPEDFPFPTILISTVHSWEDKEPEPYGLICISRPTKRMIVIRTETKNQWVQIKRWDSVRKIYDTFYEAPKELWLSVPERY